MAVVKRYISAIADEMSDGLSDAFYDKSVQAAGLRAFFTLADKWDLAKQDAIALLGDPKERTYYNWKQGKIGFVPADTMRRIGYLLGIHKALRILYRNPVNLYGWIRQPNQILGGQSPLQRMVKGDMSDIAMVRRMLDAARG